MSLANPTGEETETLPLSLLWEATQFARELFDAKMQGATFPGAGWSKPENLTPRNCFDLVHGVSVIVQATSNPYKMGWSLDEYTEAMRSRPKGKSADAEKALLDKFPPRCLPGGHPLPMEIRASVVTSNEGDVLLWYLPNLLSPSAMGDLTAAIGAFVATKNSVNVSSKGSSWRAKGGAFRDTTECNMIPGLTYFSPAWYATGHESKPPGPTPNLGKSEEKKYRTAGEVPVAPARCFLRNIRDVLVPLGALYSLIHPQLYNNAMDVIEKMFNGDCKEGLKEWEQTSKILEDWPYPFNVISVIVNRETELHQDNGGPDFGLDYLVTGGNYDNSVLETPTLGLRWMYNPGTTVAILGKIVPHSVGRVNGERFCVASFWREGLFDLHKSTIPRPPVLNSFFKGRDENENWRSDMGPLLEFPDASEEDLSNMDDTTTMDI